MVEEGQEPKDMCALIGDKSAYDSLLNGECVCLCTCGRGLYTLMGWQHRVHCTIGHPPYGHGAREIGGSHE